MTDREYKLLIAYLKIRAGTLVFFGSLTLVALVFLVFSLKSENSNDAINTIAGMAFGSFGTVTGGLALAMGRDITEYLERVRANIEGNDIRDS